MSGVLLRVVLHTAKRPDATRKKGVIVKRDPERMLALPEARENIAQAIAEAIAICLTDRKRNESSAASCPHQWENRQSRTIK